MSKAAKPTVSTINSNLPDADQKEYSVICVVPDSGQIICHHVMAVDGMAAFAAAALLDNDAEVVTAVPGHLMEGEGIFFPGETVVDAMTILEQDDVFPRPS